MRVLCTKILLISRRSNMRVATWAATPVALQELQIELLVALGECHGAEVRVLRGEAVVGRKGRGANNRGGRVGLRAFTTSCFLPCCLLQGAQVGQGLQIGLLVALGECHAAEARVFR